MPCVPWPVWARMITSLVAANAFQVQTSADISILQIHCELKLLLPIIRFSGHMVNKRLNPAGLYSACKSLRQRGTIHTTHSITYDKSAVDVFSGYKHTGYC